jgi:hypothetical protein
LLRLGLTIPPGVLAIADEVIERWPRFAAARESAVGPERYLAADQSGRCREEADIAQPAQIGRE